MTKLEAITHMQRISSEISRRRDLNHEAQMHGKLTTWMCEQEEKLHAKYERESARLRHIIHG